MRPGACYYFFVNVLARDTLCDDTNCTNRKQTNANHMDVRHITPIYHAMHRYSRSVLICRFVCVLACPLEPSLAH